MMLRSNDRYFDFSEEVQVERISKLFEALDETKGDFSYEFELPMTSNNMSLCGFPTPDAVKSIYKSVPCDLLDDDNVPLYTGQIKIGNLNLTEFTIPCSFFSGNYNWISLLSGPISDVDFSELDTITTEINIANSWDNDDGIIYPILDTGMLVTRSFPNLMREDFTGCIFIKYAFKKIFQHAGIKIKGDLLSDPLYNSMILCRNTKSQDELDNRSFYAQDDTGQGMNVPPGGSSMILTFPDDSTFPYFDGSTNNYDSAASQYIPDVEMRGTFEVQMKNITAFYGVGPIPIVDNAFVELRINGTVVESARVQLTQGISPGTYTVPPISYNAHIYSGDVVDVVLRVTSSTGILNIEFSDPGSTFKFTPSYLFFTSGNKLLPNWTQAQLVNNILALFCAITDYDAPSKTLTIDLFNNIKSKNPVDLSEHIQVNNIDFQDFISNFSKTNNLTYQESDTEEIKGYNVSEFIKYGSGEIQVDNDFIPDTGSIVDSDFSSPISYLSGTFQSSIERMHFVDVDEVVTQDFTSVTDSSGDARFDGLDDTFFEVGDLVRISESTINSYNGDYVVKTVGTGSGYIIVRGLLFNQNGTGKITKLVYKISTDDSVFVLWQTEYSASQVSDYSRINEFYVNQNAYPNVAYAYFNLLNVGRPINDQYKQSLSFGSVNNPLFYQRTMTEQYWPQVGRVLNDPLKILGTLYLPKATFFELTPLRPIRIKSIETDNLYYQNRITGYTKSYNPCSIELIKLS